MDDQPVKPEIVADAEKLAGVYANFAQVGHTVYEFTIDFVRMMQNEGETMPHGVLVARVNMSPLLVSQLLAALSENWTLYAEKALPPEARQHGSTQGDQGSSEDYPPS